MTAFFTDTVRPGSTGRVWRADTPSDFTSFTLVGEAIKAAPVCRRISGAS